MKKILLPIFSLLFFIFLIFPPGVLAENLTVECEAGVCTISPANTPIFNEDNVYPGYTSPVYQITAKNNNDETCAFAIELDNYTETGDLGDVINIYINEAGSNLYSGTLSNLNSIGYKTLSDINANSHKIYDFSCEIDGPSTGNEYQGKESKFDVIMGFECPIVLSSPSPSSTAGTTTTATAGTTGEGTGGGDTSFFGSMIFPDTGIGGFFGRVFGTEDEDIKEPEDTGALGVSDETPEVKGEEVCAWWHYLWWLPLIIQAVLLYIYYSWLDAKFAKTLDAKDAKIAYWWSVPLILSGLSQIIHEILGCECVASKWCPCYWLFNIIIFSALTFYYWKGQKKQSSDLTEE